MFKAQGENVTWRRVDALALHQGRPTCLEHLLWTGSWTVNSHSDLSVDICANSLKQRDCLMVVSWDCNLHHWNRKATTVDIIVIIIMPLFLFHFLLCSVLLKLLLSA